jgi:hypothetical protein
MCCCAGDIVDVPWCIGGSSETKMRPHDRHQTEGDRDIKNTLGPGREKESNHSISPKGDLIIFVVTPKNIRNNLPRPLKLRNNHLICQCRQTRMTLRMDRNLMPLQILVLQNARNSRQLESMVKKVAWRDCSAKERK